MYALIDNIVFLFLTYFTPYDRVSVHPEETLTKINRHVLATVLLITSHRLPSASHV